MKINDSDLWVAQQAEIASRPDAETGKVFLDFLQAWCDRAEAAMQNNLRCCNDPVEALRVTLEPTQEALGALPVGWVGQLLLAICTHWSYGGDTLFESMNPLEQRFTADAMALIQDEMGLAAQQVPDAPPH